MEKRSYTKNELLDISVSSLMKDTGTESVAPTLENALPFETFQWCAPSRTEFRNRVQYSVALEPDNDFTFAETC